MERLAALKADPKSEKWMYASLEFYFARTGNDYDGMVAVCDARLANNREDVMAMEYKVKALFLRGDEAKAFAMADTYAKRGAAADSMQLLKAELYYRQEKYAEAIALCDGVIAKADLVMPAFTPADAEAIQMALEAAAVKAAVLLLQGEPEQAQDLLNEVWDAAANSRINPSLDFAYTLLAAYVVSGDEEGIEELLGQLMYYGVPEALTDLMEGETSLKKIFTEGWGGFDA